MEGNGPMWSKDDDGSYGLVFPNKQALSKQEIKKIFSQFGKVLCITETGDNKGLRFIKFKSLEEVENAVENLENHPSIKLVPHRPKNKKNSNSNYASTYNLGKNSMSKMKAENHNTRNFFQRKLPKNNSDIALRINKTHNSKENEQLFNGIKNFDISSNNDNISIISSIASSNKTKVSHSSLKSVSPKKKIPSFIKSKIISTNTDSSLVSHNNLQCSYEEELPKLVSKEKILEESKRIILNAEEVIVANIHSDYGSAYILYLFEEFEPLAISYIKMLSKSNIRYCHVYFKTVKDSLGAEVKFDKHDLSGKNLIVLRSCRLIEEATDINLYYN